MTKYLISFPAPAMDVAEEDWVEVGEASRAVIREAKRAGVYVFAGGINEDIAPVMIAGRRGRHQRDLPADERAQRWLLRAGALVARRRHGVGREDRQSLPVLAGTSRVWVRR